MIMILLNLTKTMITKEEYLKAKKVINDYKEQLRKADVMRSEILKKEQRIREENCEDHEYEDASYKWGSPTRMKCINCDKIIND